MAPTASTLTAVLKAEAASLGFVLSGVAPAVSPQGFAHLREWIAAGYAGEMRYLADRLSAYEHPRAVLDGVQSILMLGFPYKTAEPTTADSLAGKVARYAWGPVDYHDLLHDRLSLLSKKLLAAVPHAKVRGVVDSAPLLEREFAQLAGLGWIGKNTLLLHRQQGSYFFLAALLTDQTLVPDVPFAADHCGSCTACLDACPTQAFPQPYVLDATRCISYLTIELKGAIPAALRPGIEDWAFGCDVCQEVCPWNRRAPLTSEPSLLPANKNPLALAPLFDLTEDGFRQVFRKTPLWRSKRRGILRNAAIVLGNSKNPDEAVAPLSKGIADAEPLVREAAGWALFQLGTDSALALLRAHLAVESDPQLKEGWNRLISGKNG